MGDVTSYAEIVREMKTSEILEILVGRGAELTKKLIDSDGALAEQYARPEPTSIRDAMDEREQRWTALRSVLLVEIDRRIPVGAEQNR